MTTFALTDIVIDFLFPIVVDNENTAQYEVSAAIQPPPKYSAFEQVEQR